MAITASAAQTAMTPGRPVKIAAIASSGIEIAIDPSTISFWWSRRSFSACALSWSRFASRASIRATNASTTAGSISAPSSVRAASAERSSSLVTTSSVMLGLSGPPGVGATSCRGRSAGGALELAAVAVAGRRGGVVGVVGAETGGLEEHHHEREVAGVGRVGIALHALLGGRLDAVDLCKQAEAPPGELAPATRVEAQRGAGEVRLAVVEAARRAGGTRVGVDGLQ